jgi:hypothetical protein
MSTQPPVDTRLKIEYIVYSVYTHRGQESDHLHFEQVFRVRFVAMPDAAYTCDECGAPYHDLSQHWRWHPDCRPPDLLEPAEESDDEDDEGPQPSSLATRVSIDVRREQIASDLADLRHEHGMEATAIGAVKECATRWLHGVAVQAANALKPYLLPGVSTPDVIAAIEIDMFADLKTAKQELSHMQRGTPYIEPRTVDVGTHEFVCSFDLGELWTRRLQNDSAYRKKCFAKSREWMKGDMWKQSPSGTLNNFDDAVVARWHPHLMRPATPDELPVEGGHGGDLRMASDLNADDVEVCRHLPCVSTHLT